MHYIRFLKTPRITTNRKDNTTQITAVIVVTTDLGETVYPDDLDLTATLRSPEDGGEIYLRRKLSWPASAHSLPLTLSLTGQELDWPAVVHVSTKASPNAHALPSPGFLPPVVDIWSSPLNPPAGMFESGPRVERRFTPLSERPVALLEDAGDSIARHCWDGSQALAQHIDQLISLQTPNSPLPHLEHILASASSRRLNVLELGCGCGTVGIALALAVPDADVLLSDLDEAQPLVEANIARMKPAMASRAAFVALDWTQPLPARVRARTTDLILVSECTYNTATLPPLVATLGALVARSPNAIIVVSTKTRHPDEASFWGLAAKAGLVEDGRMRMKLPGQVGLGYADAAPDVGVHVLRGREASGGRLSLSPRGSEEAVPGLEVMREKRSKVQ